MVPAMALPDDFWLRLTDRLANTCELTASFLDTTVLNWLVADSLVAYGIDPGDVRHNRRLKTSGVPMAGGFAAVSTPTVGLTTNCTPLPSRSKRAAKSLAMTPSATTPNYFSLLARQMFDLGASQAFEECHLIVVADGPHRRALASHYDGSFALEYGNEYDVNPTPHPVPTPPFNGWRYLTIVATVHHSVQTHNGFGVGIWKVERRLRSLYE